MRRRDVLRTGAGVLAASAVGSVATALPTESYAPLGSATVDGTQEVTVSDDGKTAYVAAGSGFAAVDVTDPASPTVVSEQRDLLADAENGPMKMVADVKADGDRLLVVGPNGPSRDKLVKAALLYDVSDPANPEQLAVQKVDHPIHNSFLADGHAYLTRSDFDRETMRIFDVSEDSFSEVSEFGIIDHDEKWQDVHGWLRSLHDLYVQGDYAYFANWEAGTFIVDISDKANPEVVSRLGGLDAAKLSQLKQEDFSRIGIQPAGNNHYVTVDDDAETLYIGAESWDMHPDDETRGASGIDVWDISDKTNPEELTTIRAPGSADESFQGKFTTSHNFDVRDGRLYTSWYYGGVMIHDVSDPASPERITWWRDPESTQFWGAKAAGDRDFFVAGNMGPGQDTTGGLMTFPDTAGEMADPPGVFTAPSNTSIVTESDWPDYVSKESQTTTTTAQPTTTEQTTAQPTTSDPTETTTTQADTDTATPTGTAADSEGSTPGFGILATVAGLGLGAARFRRRRDD
ncbi:LVIVD repeat-containing protein [Haloarchaeobius sp. HME9146]|uniref:LVIVD repeat-containing protein n=1 Tax=Haloarchaeobius sp. HME9146 TaxID=2978732 RepID=UPI0021BFB348|nr:PGF-CTERM sorting domain-containing protein [Haloarchaeobius sp. HME9146]MCT9095368.1 PGF-CTERM sorting domain-containing protein [Haloarchaeobius sp. HME9146]